jgi:hypothetical protein
VFCILLGHCGGLCADALALAWHRRFFCGVSMANDEPVRVWLSSEVKAALIQVAADDDRPVSTYIRRLIERDLDEKLVPSRSGDKVRCGSCAGLQDKSVFDL